MSDDDDVPTCECCGFNEVPVKPYKRSLSHRSDDLCVVCATTFASNAMVYPEQYPDADAMRMRGWVANRLLTEIALLRQEVAELRK